MIKQVRKRNGMLVDFDLSKIINAIQKSMRAEQHENLADADSVAQKVQAEIFKK